MADNHPNLIKGYNAWSRSSDSQHPMYEGFRNVVSTTLGYTAGYELDPEAYIGLIAYKNLQTRDFLLKGRQHENYGLLPGKSAFIYFDANVDHVSRIIFGKPAISDAHIHWTSVGALQLAEWYTFYCPTGGNPPNLVHVRLIPRESLENNHDKIDDEVASRAKDRGGWQRISRK